jgi:hypothetical protein
LYKRLGVEESAGDDVIRAALPSADAATREAAEFILLDPTRRNVYDRNRRALVTIGRLRANLGLNLTRFWPRPRFADFTVDLTSAAGPGRRPDDPMAMAWALGVEGPRRGRVRPWRRRAAVAAGLVLLTAAAVIAWRVRFGP